MKYSATILTIGDELLIGQTIDTNSAWMGEQLNALGVPICEKIALSDTETGIINGLERALDQSEVVLITGGLGPTKDDITKKVLAQYFGMGMEFHIPTWERIEKLFQRWGRSTTEAHKEQCYMPDDCTLLENKMGTAPGMLFEYEGKIVISMPGVPYEMKYIMENHVITILKKKYSEQAIVHHTILTSGEGESRIADRIADIINDFPDHLSIAYLPNLGMVKLRLTAIGEDEPYLKSTTEKFGAQIEECLGELVFGHGKETLSSVIGKLAIEKSKTIGTAESCTGGLVGNKIVNTPGSSSYYEGSIVSYSYELKEKLLGVKRETLQKHGAVSEDTVIEMVHGALSALGVDIAVAISGIAGPTGGTDEKPVGTIWMACGNSEKVLTMKISAGKNRKKNIEYASNYALNFVRKFLQYEV